MSLTNGGSGAIMLGSDVIAAAPIPANGLDKLSDGPLELETERGVLSVTIEPTGEPVELGGELLGRRQASRTAVAGTLTDGDRTIALDCSGVIHSRAGAGDDPALTRDATIILADGGLICLATASPGPGVPHGQEEASAAISHPGGYIDFDEVLLSTEYDSAGRHIRATLELWPASDEISNLHGAGRVVTGCSARVGAHAINTALFSWSLDGHLGMGRYEISTKLAAVPA